jgi:GNAT superfamily N-acetyltransferase
MPDSLVGPTKLTKDHYTADFESGADELDDWLKNYAWVNHCSGNARVYVVARSSRVVGYFALATAGVEKINVPDQLKRGGVPAQIPCILLARLAVDVSERNRKIGKGMLKEAIRVSLQVADAIGVKALLIHARDEKARSFYEHQGEFIQSPTDPLHLFMNLKHARDLVKSD